MQITPCTLADAPVLAEMNHQLIQDERAETHLSLPQLQARMADFLHTSYRAFFFVADEDLLGYALCDMARAPVYLRQFFICRDHRRKGYGKQAFALLLETLALQTLDVDVYAWNHAGIAFWQSLGLQTRCHQMRLGECDKILSIVFSGMRREE